MVERLAQDHTHARQLAQGLKQTQGFTLDIQTVETNIVYFSVSPELMTAQDLVNLLRSKRVGMCAVGPQEVRAVTHHGIEKDHIDQVLSAVRDSL